MRRLSNVALRCAVLCVLAQALMQQQANKLAHSRPLPLWAGLMMMVLGWNELIALLFSPFYLMLIVLLGLFGYR